MTRLVNVTLLTLFVTAVITGGVAFTLGASPLSTVVVDVHGASGLGLLVLVPAKTIIARSGFRRPGRSRKVISIALSVLVTGAIGGGVLHGLAGFTPVLGLLPMQIHVGAALLAAAALAAHVLPYRWRRWPLLRPADIDRRRVLQAAGVLAGAAALRIAVPGRPRRFTGSHETGSGDPTAMPVTQWLFDPVPLIDPATWSLRLPGRSIDGAALAALPSVTARAVIDCTGGWWAEQEWTGVPLTALRLPPSASIEVVSATGYHRRLPADDTGLLLATHAAGRPLSAGHGGPVRLVAPGRRGFWWVKWVVEIRVSDEPWWWQPPLPLR